MLGFRRSVKNICNGGTSLDVSPGGRSTAMTMTRFHLPVVGQPAPIRGLDPAGAAVAVRGDALMDGFARRVRYLRVSVTDRCNFRCSYCMPESLVDRMHFQPRAAVLTF